MIKNFNLLSSTSGDDASDSANYIEKYIYDSLSRVQKWISNTIEYLETSMKRNTGLLKVNEKEEWQLLFWNKFLML